MPARLILLTVILAMTAERAAELTALAIPVGAAGSFVAILIYIVASRDWLPVEAVLTRTGLGGLAAGAFALVFFGTFAAFT